MSNVADGSLLRSPIADELRARMRRNIDLVVLVGSSIGLLAQLVGLWTSFSRDVALTAMVVFSFATVAVLGLVRHARWTPIAYVAIIVIANALYLVTSGPWLGLGAIYVVGLALTFLFLPLRARWLVVLLLAAPPLTLGIGSALDVLTPPPGLVLDDVLLWRRASIATCTSLIGVALILQSVVSQLVAARREVERTREIDRLQRETQSRIDAELAHARRAHMIAELAAEVGAEVGAALDVIRTRQQALAAVLEGREQAREYLDEIEEAASNAASTMRSLTAFAPDARESAVAAGNATDAARALPKLVRRTIPSRISLVITADDDAWVPIPTCDLSRILSNLALNARDAIAETGTIAISVTRGDKDVEIEVNDDGTGMDAVVLGRLFQPFFTTKEIGRGTGLGLATTKVLVERAGGTIAVDSSPGRGTRFTLRLPAVAHAA